MIISVSVPEIWTITEEKDESINKIQSLRLTDNPIFESIPHKEKKVSKKPENDTAPNHICFFKKIKSQAYKISELIGITIALISA